MESSDDSIECPWYVTIANEAVLQLNSAQEFFQSFGTVTAVHHITDAIQVEYQDKSCAKKLQ